MVVGGSRHGEGVVGAGVGAGVDEGGWQHNQKKARSVVGDGDKKGQEINPISGAQRWPITC